MHKKQSDQERQWVELISYSELMTCFDKMGKEITQALSDTKPIVLSVMNGALMPTAEIMKRLEFPMELDYVHVSRYHGGEKPSTELVWYKQPTIDLTDRTVIIVDDILDGGITLGEIKKHCLDRGAKDVRTAVMLDKRVSRDPTALVQEADFVGLEIEDHYVFGFGLDDNNYCRNLKAIYTIKSEG